MQNIKDIQIEIDQEKIIQFCQRWKITEFALFGSVLRDDFRPNDSDIDVLVSFDQEARWTLFDLVEMEEEIQKIFDRKVDLVSRRGIERSHNYLRRKAILGSAKVIYAAP
ncbi:nucleotidyltransferase family protein [Leptolyngbya sp. DQ-M1]|uniref:nucleotidyltransferase family protein n=1 Tax=Leptolyngbya sp. DQ-M1 TaxID=2933920 RepID=UPI003296D3B7